MDCFIFDNNDGSMKIWCIDIYSPTELVVYFGAYQNKMQTRVIPCPDANAEMQKRIRQKLKEGYLDIDGYVDENNKFVPDHLPSGLKPKPQPTKTQEPAQSFDLSNLKNGNSFWF